MHPVRSDSWWMVTTTFFIVTKQHVTCDIQSKVVCHSLQDYVNKNELYIYFTVFSRYIQSHNDSAIWNAQYESKGKWLLKGQNVTWREIRWRDWRQLFIIIDINSNVLNLLLFVTLLNCFELTPSLYKDGQSDCQIERYFLNKTFSSFKMLPIGDSCQWDWHLPCLLLWSWWFCSALVMALPFEESLPAILVCPQEYTATYSSAVFQSFDAK